MIGTPAFYAQQCCDFRIAITPIFLSKLDPRQAHLRRLCGKVGSDACQTGDYATALQEWCPQTALTTCILENFPKYLHRLH